MPAAAIPHDDSVILAAGGIICREMPSGDEVMVVRRKRYGDWTFPKGKLKKGESFQQAAIREVREETGCSVRLCEFLGAIGYEVNGVPKVVLYWRMSIAKQGEIEDQDEVAEAIWLPVPAAIQRLTYAREKELLSGIAAAQVP
jgi:8-oxo-dGTP pyrophosphatase MutT (NUDIX family)